MTHLVRRRPLAALIYLTLLSPLLAAQAPANETTNAPSAAVVADPATAAAGCRDDLKSFAGQMAKDGYWRPSEGYGFGYPMGEGGIGTYGASPNQGGVGFARSGNYRVRRGHDVQVLIRAATILARHGEQQPCEDVLTATRGLYKTYLTDMQAGGKPMPDTPDWQERQITAAVPVSGANVAFRSDELLDDEVRSPNNVSLGSVDDLVLSPQTGKIAYLVIARGGVFGFDQGHIPVPCNDFKVTPTGSLLVLDTTKSALDGAPTVKNDTFSVSGDVGAESQKVDAYWKAHQPEKASN